jgi:uncharacterized iron-regulated protein
VVLTLLPGLAPGLAIAAEAKPTMPPTAADDGTAVAVVDVAATETAVLDVGKLEDLNGLVDALMDRRVIFVGESHDRYEDHLNQLAIIRGLHERGKDLAVGMEFFQQPFQEVLDAYIAGTLSEDDLLRRSEYFQRWRFDYRLYRPILRYARAQGLPLIALNIPAEITDKVGDGGIGSLSESEATRIPAQLTRDDPDYVARLRAVFEMHPKSEDAVFDHFLEVQLLWDEGMAERAAEYLERHPDKTLVVLAGAGHVEYGRGIPRRVTRRLDVPAATIVNGRHRPFDPALADFLLYPRSVDLPKTGLLGVMLDVESDGEGIGIQGFAENSGAAAAGVKPGDRIVKIGDEAIDAYADVRIALMDSRPGETLPVEVLRKPFVGSAKRLRFDVELH